MTTWLDRFAVAAEAFKSAWGAAVDLATSPFDQDDESFAEIAGKLGQLTIGSVNSVAQMGLGLGGGVLWGAEKLSENLVLEPLSTAFTSASLADSETWLKSQGLTQWNAMFSGSTWSKAREIADRRSMGQSFVSMFATKDVIAEEQEIERLKQDSFLFNAVSGTLDAAANIFLDPTIVGSKAVSATKAVKRGFGTGHRPSDPWLQRQLAKRGVGMGDIDPYDYAHSKAVTDFLTWTDGKNGRQIANHEAVKASPYRSVLAGLLQDADRETKRLIVAVGYGSKPAFEQLAARRDDLAMRVARADNNVNFALQYEVSRGWRDRMPTPPIKQKPEPRQRDNSEQLSLFDVQPFPAGKPGAKGAGGSKGPTSVPVPPKGQTGPAGKAFDYPNISGNLPKTVEGQYFIAPKTASEGGPYWMKGPVTADSIKGLQPYFNTDAKARAAQKWEQLSVPGLPPESNWKAARSWNEHAKTLNQKADEWGEELSMRIMPWDRQATKWFRSYQRELAQKQGKELDILNAAIGSGGEGRGIWGSMINQVITPGDKQLMKADRTLAYDWETRSGVAERIVQPKAYGLPVRVIQGIPFHIARAFTEKRPPSWIDPNRGDSHAGFAAWLNNVQVFAPQRKDMLLREYMSAFEPHAKREILVRAEASALKEMAIRYGLSEDAADAIARRSVGERNSIIQQLRKEKPNRYAADVAVTERNFPYEDFPVDDDLIPVTSPIFETQEVNSIPLLDLDKFERAFRQHSDKLNAFQRGAASVADFMDKAYDVFNPLWSFSVLMRLGYTVRTLTDDMLRIWASLGSMSIMGSIHAGVRNMLTEDGTSWKTFNPSKGALGQRVRNIKTGLQRTAIGAVAATSPRDVADVLRQHVDRMGRDIESVRTISDLGFEYRGQRFTAPYGGKGESYRQIVGGSYEAIARTSAEIIEKLRSDYAGWDVKNPGDADHLDSWLYTVNNQIAKSALGRKLLEGMTGEQLETWLRRSAEGQQVRKKIGTFGRDPQRLAGMAQATVDQYLPLLRDSDDPFMLRRLALRGELTSKHLEEAFPEVLDRPQVHGPSVDINLHQGAVHKYMDSIVSTGFKWLSQIPSDKLMRHPHFRSLYQDSIRRQYDNYVNQLGDEAAITGDDLKAMEHTARETALKGVNDLLYNLGTKSNAAHMMRFGMSFFSAWEDSLTKWSRLAMDKPQLLFIGSKVYEAPNEMNFGMTTDEHGNRVPRIQVVDEQGRPVPPDQATVDGKERIIARLPEWLKKAVGAEDFGAVAIPKASLNLILQGNPWWLPGAGPLAQVAISPLVAKAPHIKEVYDWAIPFGPQSVADVMLPGWLKQAVKGNVGLEDPAFAYMYLNIAQTEEMRYREGQRSKPTPQEIQKRAEAAFKVRSFTRFFLPFQADMQSPYQFYLDQYRQLAEIHGDQADELFYEKFGEDLYLFTTALSKNNIGLKATKSAWLASKEYGDLIAANPEYGALIVGPDLNAGKFNQYIHEAQFSQKVKPGTTLTARERRSPLDALNETDKKLGWMKFQKYMGLVTNMEEQGGYSSEQINAARRAIVDFIGEKHEHWLNDYNTSDRAALPNRIDFFESLVKDRRLINNPLRTDIRVLSDYLTVRRQWVSHMAALKAADRPHTLEAKENAALADEWRRVRESFAASDTRFHDLYWRYLSRDELQVA